MRNYKTITQLSTISSLEDQDVLPIVDVFDDSQSPVGSTKKVSLSQIRNFTLSGTSWMKITSGSVNLEPNVSYSADGISLISFILPTESYFGDTYRITGPGTGLFRVQQNSGQSIIFDTLTTTIGAGGYILSTIPGNAITITCMQDNTLFQVIDSMGIFDVE